MSTDQIVEQSDEPASPATPADPGRTLVSAARRLPVTATVVSALLVTGIVVAHGTEFGRTVYAIGGSEYSAMLMGLPVARTTVLVYTFSGFCSALAGVVFTFYMLSGYGLHAQGLELDAIAATVIGGALLSGGVGYVLVKDG